MPHPSAPQATWEVAPRDVNAFDARAQPGYHDYFKVRGVNLGQLQRSFSRA